MSSVVQEQNEAQDMAAGLTPLLREYAKKFRRLSGEVRRIQEGYVKAGALQVQAAKHFQLDFEGKRFGFNRLSTPATDLIRQASQLVENGKVETVTRLELALRLAELEVAHRDAQKRVGSGIGG